MGLNNAHLSVPGPAFGPGVSLIAARLFPLPAIALTLSPFVLLPAQSLRAELKGRNALLPVSATARIRSEFP